MAAHFGSACVAPTDGRRRDCTDVHHRGRSRLAGAAARRAGGLGADPQRRVRPLRHPRRVPPARRGGGRVDLPPPSQGTGPAAPLGTIDVVAVRRRRRAQDRGSPTNVVDRRAVRRRLAVLRPRRAAGVLRSGVGEGRRRDVLRRFDLLHLRLVPVLRRGDRQPRLDPAPAGPPPPLPPGDVAAPLDRLVGDRDPARGDLVLQRDDVPRRARQLDRERRGQARVASGRDRLGLLPDRQLPGLGGGVPQHRPASLRRPLVVDRRAQPARFGVLRRVGDRRLRGPRHR